MKLYQSSSKENFLEEVARFVIANFAGNFSKLNIILPSGLLCNHLQKLLITKLGSTMLPTITPLAGLVAESEEIFKIPSEKIGAISKLEEKITLSEVIHSYKKLGYDPAQSLLLAPSLANLFFEFEVNNITLAELKNIPILDQPEHWHSIYDFLSYASDNWYVHMKSLHKVTRASYQKLTFRAKLEQLEKAPLDNMLIAGIAGVNQMTDEFIQDASKLPNCYVILPPSGESSDSAPNRKFSPEDALYKIDKLLHLINKEKAPIPALGTGEPTILNKLLTDSACGLLKQRIDYLEFDNIFHEANYIATQCMDALEQNPDSRIAIIVSNLQSKEQYCTFLAKYQLRYHDLLGTDIGKHNAMSLILLIAEHLCCEFSLKTFFAILSHPLVNNTNAQEVKNLIRKYDRLCSSLESISTTIKQHGEEHLQEYIVKLHESLSAEVKSNKFASILRLVIKSVELLLPDLWKQNPDIAASLSEIVHINWSLALKKIDDFPELLKQIISGGRLAETTSDQNITICKSHDAALANYDLIIMADLNEGTHPAPIHSSPWLSAHMQKELKLDSKPAEFGNALYDFYLNLQNKCVLLTRACKHGSMQMLPSPFILQLKHILGDKLNCKTMMQAPQAQMQTLESAALESAALESTALESTAAQQENSLYATSKIFPKQISATDIETLLRSPYNFYAKKILNLRMEEEIEEKPNLAQFGNFFHEVAEEYTKNYNASEMDKPFAFKEIGQTILSSAPIPEHSKRSWGVKLSAIACEFVEWDEKRRQNITTIYTELKGQITLDIKGTPVRLIAIADRIEIDKEGNAVILDYKTGAVPTKKDVLSGLSPQLLTEAIILSGGGFNIGHKEISKLIYVKINSSLPYIKTTEIELSKADIHNHKQGLISLLEHYVTSKSFPLEQNLMKYDNYTHLARRGAG
ncbi:MAG: hypothetical protein COA94_05820 [Rickettsiales bacterium]|nr:MAG: hypothetical protein COA94_05820 [Rickettsiales bacterium]